MNKLVTAKQVTIVPSLADGNLIRATCRATPDAEATVRKLRIDLRKAYDESQKRVFFGLPCKRVH